MNFILFVILFYLVINTFKEKKEIQNLLFILVLSGFIVALCSFLSFLNLPPFKNFFLTPVGRVNDLLAFILILFPLALILSFLSSNFYKKIILLLFSGFFFFEVLLINEIALKDSYYGWLIFIIEASLLLILLEKYLAKRNLMTWRFVLMGLILVGLFFILVKSSFSFPLNIPPQVSPTLSAEKDIIKGVFKEGLKEKILGTGPSTFVFNWSKYHSPLINRTPFWGIRFASGSSGILDWLITKGILGFLSLILLFGYTIFLGAKKLIEIKEKEFPYLLVVAILISLIILVIFDIVFVLNFVHWFLFWILLAFLVILSTEKEKKIHIQPGTFYFPLFSFVLLGVIIFGIGGLTIEGKKYLAEAKYFEASKKMRGGNIEKAIKLVQDSIKLDPSMDLYHRDLAQLYLTKSMSISIDPSLSDIEKRNKIQNLIQKGIFHINESIKISPKNVANWNVRGFFYRNFIGLPGADEVAISSYKKAIELEPASPYAYGELGRVYLISSQISPNPADREKALKEAEKYLQKAIDLKGDYAPAHYLLALIYDLTGKTEEAISKLEKLKLVTPNDAGIYFQLGAIYWRKNELNKAQIELERAIQILPNYSNARYILGLVYDKKGEKEKAIQQFQEIAKLNPQNENIKKILDNLKNGLPALEGIASSEILLEETPPEIKE